MNITTENIDEWCFRYLEKDLDVNECAFFEKELQTNSILQKEYALWKKTKITDFTIDVSDQVNTSLLRYNNQLITLVAEFSVVIGICLLSLYFQSANTIQQEVKPIMENSAVDTISKKEFALEYKAAKRINVIKENAKILKPLKVIDIDSTKQVNELPESTEDIVLHNDEKITVAIEIPKDSIIKNIPTKKIKPTNKKRRTGSKLLPINNDL